MIRFTPAAPGGPAIDWTSELARRAERSRHPALQTFYQAGCVSGDTPLQDAPLMALDIETTGLDARRDAGHGPGLRHAPTQTEFQCHRAVGPARSP